MTNPTPAPATPSQAPPQARSVLLGGLVPVVLFTVIEEVYGVIWGLVAGMAFGLGEILWEWRRYGKVSKLTWFGNGLIVGLGSISLFTREGVWFKLQPAIMEIVMGLFCVGSFFLKRPFMVWIAREQGAIAKMPPDQQAPFERELGFFTLRMGVFFLAASVIAVWSALFWSTRAWALTKGLGFTAAMMAYVLLEALVIRSRLTKGFKK